MAFLRVLLWVWTFPLPLWALINSRKRVEPDFDGYRTYEHRWWFKGYAHAAWPRIFFAAAQSRSNTRLMRHEARHLQQQAVFGPLFLPLYGLFWLVLFVFAGGARAAHRLNPFELDARAHEGRTDEEAS